MRLLIEAAAVALALGIGYVIGRRSAYGALRLPFISGDRLGRKTIAR